MHGMLNNPINNVEQLKEMFTKPPQVFLGEAPSTESLLNNVFIEDTLANAPKQMPFDVPVSYFDTPLPMPKETKYYGLTARWVSISQAACIALMLGLSFLMFKPTTTNNTSNSISSISPDEALWYLENHDVAGTLSWYEWETKLSDVDVTNINNAYNINDINREDVSNFF